MVKLIIQERDGVGVVNQLPLESSGVWKHSIALGLC